MEVIGKLKALGALCSGKKALLPIEQETCVHRRVSLDASKMQKTSCSCWESNHNPSSTQPMAKSLFHYALKYYQGVNYSITFRCTSNI